MTERRKGWKECEMEEIIIQTKALGWADNASTGVDIREGKQQARSSQGGCKGGGGAFVDDITLNSCSVLLRTSHRRRGSACDREADTKGHV